MLFLVVGLLCLCSLSMEVFCCGVPLCYLLLCVYLVVLVVSCGCCNVTCVGLLGVVLVSVCCVWCVDLSCCLLVFLVLLRLG